MDVATIILGIGLINIAVFLAGCTLAALRSRGERTAVHRLASGPIAGRRAATEAGLRHAGRRAH